MDPLLKEALVASNFLDQDQNPSIDFYPLVEAIFDATKQTAYPIRPDDFHPIRLAMILEPFLKLIGYGSYNVRPSALCGFVACLVNSESVESIPVDNFFDVARFHRNMMPLLPKLTAERSNVSWILAQRLKWIFSKCRASPKKSPVPVPDLFEYLTDPSKLLLTRNFVDHLQFIVIHNNMDSAVTDILRRCQCSSMSPSPQDPSSLVASCTGCI